MGYMRHHAIVVTSWKGAAIEAAHEYAEAIQLLVSPITPEAVNGYRSFFVAPDGSKEGWPDSDAGDRRRDDFVAWLERANTDEIGLYTSWAEVQFGDEGGDQLILRASNDQFSHPRAELYAKERAASLGQSDD